jgi:hypothetical protein
MKRLIICLFVLFVLAAIILYLINSKKVGQPIQSSSPEVVRPTNIEIMPMVESPTVLLAATNIAANGPSRSASPAERGAWERAMDKQDPYWEYKLPISFYGKIMDDSNQPISGASVAFSWVDLSQEGTTQQSTVSDELGNFSLVGKTGKSLTVQVVKNGYKLYRSSNYSGFDYSPLSNPERYYYPDPNNPVIFGMRKNREGEALIAHLQTEAKLETNGQSKLFPIGNGDEHILIERLPNEASNPRFWDAQITVPDGGLKLTTEEFPYEAPEDGYTNDFIMTSGVSVQSIGMPNGMFYVKTPNGYARIKVYYIPNKPWIYMDSWFNPNPNSRNLEVDPSKVQIIKP